MQFRNETKYSLNNICWEFFKLNFQLLQSHQDLLEIFWLALHLLYALMSMQTTYATLIAVLAYTVHFLLQIIIKVSECF